MIFLLNLNKVNDMKKDPPFRAPDVSPDFSRNLQVRGRASWGNPQRFEELVKLTMGKLILIDTKITKA